jgi:hypothetical protein
MSTRELEEAWRKRVRAARDEYIEETNRLASLRAEFSALSDLNVDGSFALSQARKRETRALHEYMRVLQKFTDLVVHEIIPDEEP